MTAAILIIESCVLVLLTLLVAGLLRSHAEILRRLHALGAGLDPDAPSGSLSTRNRRSFFTTSRSESICSFVSTRCCMRSDSSRAARSIWPGA